MLNIPQNFKLNKELKPRLLKSLKSLLENSTSHGLPNIVRSNRPAIKILWAICFLISFSTCSFMVIKTISDYLKYETVSKIEYITELRLSFPIVTICNVNPFTSNESERLVLDSLIKIGYNHSIDDLIKDKQFEKLYAANIFSLLVAFDPAYGNENKKKLSYDMVMSICTFNEEPCSQSVFEWVYDVNFGSCLRFNTKRNFETIKPGYKNGLFVQFFVPKSENKLSFVSYEGLKVFISEDLHPSLTGGIIVETSKYTEINLHKTIIKKEPFPYSECYDLDSNDSDLYEFMKSLNMSYNQQDCFNLCLQRKIIEKCECYDLNYPKLLNVSPCLSFERYMCAFKEYVSFKKNKMSKECLRLCPLECESVVYDFSGSSAKYPNEYGYQVYKDILTGLSYAQVKEGTVAFSISYPKLSYTRISESPKISFIDMLSNLGGTLGLYIGISFLSLIEIVEMLLEVVFISFSI